MDTADLAALPLADRLEAMEALWDALCRDDDGPPSPRWHEPILRERRELLAGEPTSSLDDVQARLQHLKNRR